MKPLYRSPSVLLAFVTASVGAQQTATSTTFSARDIFDLEWVSDPQISPDGRRVIFGRSGYDVMTDVKRSTLWIANSDGSDARALLPPGRQASSPRWSPDGSRILFASSTGGHTELVVRQMESGKEARIAKRAESWGGISWSPDGTMSPDGKLIAYAGLDDREQGWQMSHLYVMNRDGSNRRMLAPTLDRELNFGVWSADGSGLYVYYDDQGDTKLAFVPLAGDVRKLADRLGGLSITRPHGGAYFTVAKDGRFIFTLASPDRPADLAMGKAGAPIVRITNLNDDIWAKRKAATVEEIWFTSSFDQRRIQGWITKPADFDPRRKYPLVLDIHGGPWENYGARFSSDNQLYAADGFVVLSANPRGSTSYGEEFATLINHDYPNHDYDDLISGVDAVIALGVVSPDSLFVTGGSGGGILTAWIVGHTNRFRAAVAAKPMVNWASAVLTSDGLSFNARYFFGTMPWDDPESYRRRSPLTYVGNVTTPTMLITGDQDFRAPSSEAEQFYGALKIRKIPTAMLRIPDASHDIDAKASNLIAKAVYTIGWFDKYRAKGPVP